MIGVALSNLERMFSKYYQTELTYLRELGREFAAQNPSLASPFAERGGDPDVERLLEGFAFLTARIRERIDDALPEVIQALTGLLLPHFARTIPAVSIVAFEPHHSALRGRHRVEAGTELGARAVEGTTCLFRTIGDLDLLPLRLSAAHLDRSHSDEPSLTLSFLTSEAGRAATLHRDGFRLFLHGPLSQAALLAHWLDHHLVDVRYVAADGERSLGRSVVRRAHQDTSLIPWPAVAPVGFRFLQEYFSFAEKLLFFEVGGLERLAPQGPGEFNLRFVFHRPPKLPERIESSQFRLHCAPVVNLFPVSADPLVHDWRQHEYLLRASGVDPRHAEVYSVEEVVGLRGAKRGRLSYRPFFDYAHVTEPEPAFFALRQARSPVDGGVDTYLSVLTPRDVAPSLEEETLSVDLWCTNRGLPAELRVGDISVPTPRSPTVAKFSNITRVSRPVPPPLGSELHWRLVGHLGLNLSSLGQVETLRSFLGLYNLHPRVDQQLGRSNELRGASVRRVQMTPAQRLLEGGLVRGVQTVVELDEASLAGAGDAALLGLVLDQLFADRVSMNSFHQLTIRLHPSRASWTYAPKTGLEPLL